MIKMGKIEFQLNYYFNMYKDKALPNRDEFRLNFRKKHGKFQYINELIRMIEDYQMKKYGETLNSFIKERSRIEALKIQYELNAKNKRRLGR